MLWSYLIAAAVGTALPYWFFGSFFYEHGWDGIHDDLRQFRQC
jgi:hypothetical protein